MSNTTLPGTALPRTAVLYDASGNPVTVLLGGDGTYSLSADPRLLAEAVKANERLDRLVEIGEDLLAQILDAVR